MNTSTLRVAVLIASAIGITAVATAAVTSAVTANGDTLSPQDVNDLLGNDGTAGPTGTPDPSVSTSTSASGDEVATLVPGIVTVHCDGDLATLVSWSPNPGFRSDDPVRGPAAYVSVRFESDYNADYKVTGSCADGVATILAGPDVDDHGGGDSGRNRGPGGGS